MKFGSTFTPSSVQPSARLLVFVPGWAESPSSLREIVDLARETMPDADSLVIRHEGSSLFSNVRPEVLADRIAYEIDTCDERKGRYAHIVLIGHSAGALLLRKALVFALGSLEDSEAKRAYEWPARVERIIGLAGIERGVPIAQKPDNMSVVAFLLRRTAYNVARLLRTAKFIRALQRGEPFVANLRVQWIRLLWSVNNPQALQTLRTQWLQDLSDSSNADVAEKPFPRVPPVFQLVGDRDSLVSRSDSVDELLRSRTYVYRSVINATHASILWPSRSPYVKRALVEAFTEKPNRNVAIKQSSMTDVFYVMHGIRDLGRTWTPGICEEIRRQIAETRGGARKGRTVRSSYGYFSMLSFLFSADRQKNVRWFVDLYTQMIARYPDAVHHFVGHSNGTYLLASALQRYATCRFQSVVFAGSVVPCAFDWTKYQQMQQVSYVRNDAGSADWVVGIFPHFFEFIANVLSQIDLTAPTWMDLGGAGFYGFYDDSATNNTWLPGDHGAALVATNFASIATSVVNGIDCAPGTPIVQQNGYVTLLSKFNWLLLPVLAGLLVAGEVYLWRIGPLAGVMGILLLLGIMFTI